MKDLIIIGAGNVGAFIKYNIELFNEKYNIVGFMDSDQDKIGSLFCDSAVFDMNYLTKIRLDNVCIVIAIANPQIKKKIYAELEPLNITFPNFISKNSWISNSVNIGKGVIIYPGCSINYETNIEDFVTINMNCAIGHNVTVGSFSTLAPGVNLAGFTNLQQGVNMGIGSCTKQQIIVGENAIVGGQSMIIHNVDANITVAGSPAKQIH